MTQDILEKIRQYGVLPTISFENVDEAVTACTLLSEKSIHVIEVMLRSENSLESIKKIKNDFPNFVVGAGTVKNIKDVETAIGAGADFVVSPFIDINTIQYCLSKDILIVPGVSTAQEIAIVTNLGVRTVKYFPAESLGGSSAIALLAGVFPEVSFIPTGGITTENFMSYLRQPTVIAVGGGFVFDKEALRRCDFPKLLNHIDHVLDVLFQFRIKHLGINMENNAEASDLAMRFNRLFNFNVEGKSKSYFAGDGLEIMKTQYFGEKGHIGIVSSDVDRAFHYLKRKGIMFIESSIVYTKNGRVKMAYLEGEYGGFAVHLMAEE